MASNTASSDERTRKLTHFFYDIINGKTPLGRRSNQFLEAICVQPDAPTCINKILASKQGLLSLQSAMRSDLSPTFCNKHASRLFTYLSAPELCSIGNGSLLKPVLDAIIDPPIFWEQFRSALVNKKLDENGQFGFVWLLYHIIHLFPAEKAEPFREVASQDAVLDPLINCERLEVRNYAHKIKHRLAVFAPTQIDLGEAGPGGRHDNDFVNFREISIVPTADEVQSTQLAFIRQSSMFDNDDLTKSQQATYLDNQFRLLREDMLYEIREELVLEKKRKKHRNVVLEDLTLLSVHYKPNDPKKHGVRWAIVLQCKTDFPVLRKVKKEDRKKWLQENRQLLRHQSIACLLVGQELVALTTIERDEDFLSLSPPQIVAHIEGPASIVRALLKLKTAPAVKLLQIDTALFAYEPVLRAIQQTKVIPLSDELLFWRAGSPIEQSSYIPTSIIKSLKINPMQDLKKLLNTSKPIVLDKSQAASFVMGLTQVLSLIQGPPGTGKSFIGALLAKAHHDLASRKILVVCYTNHALDQFLEDLLDIGIPESSMIRLGGKSTDRTKSLSLHNVQRGSPDSKLKAQDWSMIKILQQEIADLDTALTAASQGYHLANPSYQSIMDYLEFDDVDAHYFDAFTVPPSDTGEIRVNRRGKALDPLYLFRNWVNGFDAGALRDHAVAKEAADVWEMSGSDRRAKLASWKEAILSQQVASIADLAKKYDQTQAELDAKFDLTVGRVLASRRIIGCTTTAAAKYRDEILAASPDLLLVEEAGEILESHVLTALGQSIEKVILIGDHKQLRPKVNNYQLTVEKGEGYDLNRSLFERLVLKGYPHETLSQQHRMRPEISALVRHLTYPDLIDAPKTQGRDDIKGLRSNVTFIHHTEPEDDLVELNHFGDAGELVGTKSSKKNKHEVQMVLKILRYLGQQGYRTDQIVILTPYLGQLRALQEALKVDNDPVLNDLDSADLVRAGLVTAAAAKLVKKPIRLATIDNYQGEESDIVIASLTRSNSDHKIGFMAAAERVNVLLSRARNGLIIIGNAETFQKAKVKENVWPKLIEFLSTKGYIYDGLPTRCERHPSRIADLKYPDDFDQKSPDGGCTQSCGKMLSCGVHSCPSKCHQLYDHSKMRCEQIMHWTCPKGHRKPWKCYVGPPDTCSKCEEETKIAKKKQQEAFRAQEERDRKQREHDQKMADLDAKIEQCRAELREKQLEAERQRAYEVRQQDLHNMTSAPLPASSAQAPPSTGAPIAQQRPRTSTSPTNATTSSSNAAKPTSPTPSGNSAPNPIPSTPSPMSPAEQEWKRQKEVEGAQEPAIDNIMGLGGLEKVKQEILNIKSKVEITARQGTSLRGERFSVSMLGNPGTGKTTVARYYGQFLASMKVVEGTLFKESTGSSLANDGVPGVKKIIEELVNNGGGTFFIDEAYQLTSGSNFQGGAVLDYLLAEIENQIGKIVFIFAGYRKEMEKFFEHNPGLKSRIPYTFEFEDYTDKVLMDILERMITKKFGGRMRVDDEGGIRGLYGRIAVRRLGRGRGRPGFGNARSLENLLARMLSRQAERIASERRNGGAPDDLLLVREDLIGPDPSTVMTESAAWKKLQGMIGLQSVKDSVQSFFSMVGTNYQRELLEKEPHAVSLNRVFYGNPGTGKTTVAKLYGQILADLGLLSNGEVVVKNPSDFVGSALGESEKQTKAILATTEGKVLVIDEAYMLYAGKGVKDVYKTAVIDTIVAEVQSVPGEDRCVLLLGYKEQMEEMFQNVNPGLSRRFAIENAFQFEDYDDGELLKALEWKLKDQDLAATDEAKRVAIEVLSRARNRPNFGNIGEVENRLSMAKVRYQKRQTLPDAPFEPEDFDPDYRRSEGAATSLAKLFEDTVGSEAIVEKLGRYQQMAAACKVRGMDPREMVPTNFIFKGPPGTGKTTTARKMGQVYFDMGFLSSTEVVECSTSDLVAEYVGQTGPKTKQLLEKALGRVLFIDEAYRLGEGHFAKEAVDELVSNLTLERYKGKIIVVLAGYDQEMNSMLAVNPGLSSRFTEEIVFTNLGVEACMQLIEKELEKKRIRCDLLTDRAAPDHGTAVALLTRLSDLPSWGNARDLKEIAKKMIARAFTDPALVPDAAGWTTLPGPDGIACIEDMLSQRENRSSSGPSKRSKRSIDLPARTLDPQPAPVLKTETTTTKTKTKAKRKDAPPPPPGDENGEGRDPEVSDEVWRALQEARRAEELERKREAEERESTERKRREAQLREKEAALQVARAIAAEQAAKDEEERNELMRQREQARLRELALREERAKIERMLEERRREEERKRKEEAKVQAKIREMGICPAGFRWIKMGGGYRCSGGAHWLSDSQLGI